MLAVTFLGVLACLGTSCSNAASSTPTQIPPPIQEAVAADATLKVGAPGTATLLAQTTHQLQPDAAMTENLAGTTIPGTSDASAAGSVSGASNAGASAQNNACSLISAADVSGAIGTD